MRIKSFHVVVSMIVIIGLSVSGAFAGVVVTNSDGSVMMLQNGKIKQTGAEGPLLIVNTSTEELVLINNQSRTYVQATLKEFCDAVRKATEQMMQSIPPQQRQMMQMYGGGMMGATPEIRVEKSGSGGKIAGYHTTKYNVYMNGQLYEEIWVAKGTPMEREVKSMGRYERFAERMKNCTAMPGMAVSVSPFETSKEYQAIFNSGWVLRRITHPQGVPMMGGQGVEREEVTGIETRSIPEAEFQPPEGYRRISPAQMYNMPNMQ